MTAEVINFDVSRTHFILTDPIDNRHHVVPVHRVVSIVDGDISIAECDPSMIRALIRHLLEVVADG
ncbi:hypothetical protein D3C85_1529770 [compost metagenome]